jgi:hypothetical protein
MYEAKSKYAELCKPFKAYQSRRTFPETPPLAAFKSGRAQHIEIGVVSIKSAMQ